MPATQTKATINPASLQRVHPSKQTQVLNSPINLSESEKRLKVPPPSWKRRDNPTTQRRYNLRSSPTNFRHLATQTLLAQHIHQKNSSLHIYNQKGQKQTLATLLQGSDNAIWNSALSNEWGKLASGNTNGVIGTETLDFFPKKSVPSCKKITYGSFVCNYKPLKTE